MIYKWTLKKSTRRTIESGVKETHIKTLPVTCCVTLDLHQSRFLGSLICRNWWGQWNSDKALLGLRLHREDWKQVQISLLALVRAAERRVGKGQGQGSKLIHLNGMRVGVDPWIGPQGWLRWSAYPLAVLCRDMFRTLIYSKSGSWVFCLCSV